MTIEELKVKIDATAKQYGEGAGMPLATSKDGPVGLPLIRAIYGVLERQQLEIHELRKRSEEEPSRAKN